jgi:predicted amidohydrolase/GNAT superfamily N-acetyltransferase
MKICIAQTQSFKGEIHRNIQNHLRIIKRAIQFNSDVIICPELSITNYEPTFAKTFVTTIETGVFEPFQILSDENNITIGIGLPTNSAEGIHISMLIFQPNKNRIIYSKQLLHDDERLYFTSGNHQVFLNIKGVKIAIGICYETLQREHFLNTNHEGADIYIASVAKSKAGIDNANVYFPKMAKEFNTPILMSNSVGYCDNFLSTGQSAAWNKNGVLIKQLDNTHEGILIYDSNLETVEFHQSIIEKGKLSDLEVLFQMYLNGKNELERNGIHQWTSSYPTIAIIEKDLRKGVLYVLKKNNEIVGAINISEEQETEYQSVNWKFEDSKVLVVHRLVVNPKNQRQGFAQKLMDFAEDYAMANDYYSIRLDAYSQNKRVIDFYKKRNYVIRGNVNFLERAYPFHCMEKNIKKPSENLVFFIICM